mgnify:CR=1 FL=1
MENCFLKQCLSGVLLIIFIVISDNGVRADVNFKSRPTTIKTFENDSVLLPCYSTGKKGSIAEKKFLARLHTSFFPFTFCDIFWLWKILLSHALSHSQCLSFRWRNLIMKNYFRMALKKNSSKKMFLSLWVFNGTSVWVCVCVYG